MKLHWTRQSEPPKSPGALQTSTVPCHFDFALRSGADLWLIGWVLSDEVPGVTLSAEGGASCPARSIIRYDRPDVSAHFGIAVDRGRPLGIAARFETHLPADGELQADVIGPGYSVRTSVPATISGAGPSPSQQLRSIWRHLMPALRASGASGEWQGFLQLLAVPSADHQGGAHLCIDHLLTLADGKRLVSGWAVSEAIEQVLIVQRRDDRLLGDLAPIWARTPRPDVAKRYPELAAGGQDHGFVALLQASADAVDPLCYSLTLLSDGTVLTQDIVSDAFPTFPSLIRHVTSLFPPDHPQIRDLISRHIGPAIEAAWEQRIEPALTPRIKRFGPASPETPDRTIIVPLYGRYDFMRHQLALFADDPDLRSAELIYVVDDPRIAGAVEQLAMDLAPLFGVAFSVVGYGTNLGFAGANNVAARLASGATLILLNSDVMPKTSGWASTLATYLARLPDAGIVGTTLLYEDGSLQHAGMRLAPHARWGGLPVNLHPGKGLSYQPFGEPIDVPAVTAACLAIRRSDYLAMGGLDEGFLRGDFEDSDLCFRMTTTGKKVYCADVPLYHLERQSQAPTDGDAWLRNLTIYNGWRHAQRIEQRQCTS